MEFMLDTNIVSALLRQPHGLVAQGIARVGPSNVCISIVVAAEVRFGIAKKASRRLAAQFDAVLEKLDIVPLAPPADRLYAELRLTLERGGNVIGANDMLIAAHALARNSTLVTDNMREFSRIPSLKLENWLG
jgi:tRNA(fMet)-specific endonuclease VapC